MGLEIGSCPLRMKERSRLQSLREVTQGCGGVTQVIRDGWKAGVPRAGAAPVGADHGLDLGFARGSG